MNSFILGVSQDVITHTTGIILGWIILIGYLLAAIKYPVRVIYRSYVMTKPVDSRFRTNYLAFMRYTVAVHPYIGLYLIPVIILHSMVELVHRGFFVTGVIASVLIVGQIILGAYGTFFRGRKKGPWLNTHRTLAAALLPTVAIHVLAVTLLLRTSSPVE